jgi:hypothetical protein
MGKVRYSKVGRVGGGVRCQVSRVRYLSGSSLQYAFLQRTTLPQKVEGFLCKYASTVCKLQTIVLW